MKIKWQIWVNIYSIGILVLAFLGFAGFFSSKNWLSSFGESYIPMAPFTASCFIVMALSLIWLTSKKMKRWMTMSVLILSLIIIILILFSIADSFFLKSINIEDYVIVRREIFNGVYLFRMSPAAKILFLLAASDLVIYIVSKEFNYKAKLAEYAGGIITIVVLISGYIFCVSYLYGKPLFYNAFGIIPMAISTALAFVLFSLSMLIIKHELFPVKLLVAKSTHGILLRFILPLVLIPMVLFQIALLFAFDSNSYKSYLITMALNLIVAFISGWLAIFISKYLSETVSMQTHKINESEKTLRQSEEKFRSLYETMIQGVVYQDANGQIIDANPSACRILGLTMDQMLGRTSFDNRWKVVDKEGNELPGDQHPAMVALKTGKEVTNFLMGVVNPGVNQFVWILVNSMPQFVASTDKPQNVCTTFLEITALKYANDENKALKNDLEKQVELKTRELNIKIEELENFYNVTIERELRMEELRQEIEQLKSQK